jgi:molybdopterin-guanine dinucleotide biosynthesis protein A
MLVRRDQHAALHAYLLSGQRKVSGWQQAQGAVAVPYDNSDQSLFFNVNTPADRDRAQTLPPPAS